MFVSINTNYLIIAKFEVELSNDMVTRHENIPVLWAEYLSVLEEAKKALEMNKDKFKNGLLDQAEVSLIISIKIESQKVKKTSFIC